MTSTILTLATERKLSSKTKTQAALTYEQAVYILLNCNAEIYDAAKLRTSHPIPLRHNLKLNAFLKTGAVVGAVDVSLLEFLPPGTMTNGMFLILAAGSLIAPFASTHLPSRVLRVISPVHARKEAAHEELARKFRSLKNDHFSELEAEILTKATPAMDFINELIAGHNQQIVYSNGKGYMDPHFAVETTVRDGFTCTVSLGNVEDLSVDSLKRRAENIRNPHRNMLRQDSNAALMHP